VHPVGQNLSRAEAGHDHRLEMAVGGGICGFEGVDGVCARRLRGAAPWPNDRGRVANPGSRLVHFRLVLALRPVHDVLRRGASRWLNRRGAPLVEVLGLRGSAMGTAAGMQGWQARRSSLAGGEWPSKGRTSSGRLMCFRAAGAAGSSGIEERVGSSAGGDSTSAGVCGVPAGRPCRVAWFLGVAHSLSGRSQAGFGCPRGMCCLGCGAGLSGASWPGPGRGAPAGRWW
jgi:hypothetical protein